MQHRHYNEQSQMPLQSIDSGPGVELSHTPSQQNHQHVSQEDGGDDTSTDSYEYLSANDLNMLQGAALLTADCLGTGLLALPQDVKVLGKVIGLGFLILNLPINLYAGTILSHAAQHIEEEPDSDGEGRDTEEPLEAATVGRDGLVRVSKGRKAYSSIASSDTNTTTATGNSSQSPTHQTDEEDNEEPATTATVDRDGLVRLSNGQKAYSSIAPSDVSNTAATGNASPRQTAEALGVDKNGSPQSLSQKRNGEDHPHHDSSTFDYIGLTQELFPCNKHAFRIVLSFYYTNIFLVLGE